MLLLVFAVGGCGGSDREPSSERAASEALPGEEEPPPPIPSPAGAAPEPGAEHLRVLAFVSLPSDSLTLLPFRFRATVTEEGTLREREVVLGRETGWEPLLADTVLTPLTRFPWRILPGGPLDLVVGDEDAVVSLRFDDPPRSLELLPGEYLAEWIPGPGAAWRLYRGRILLPSGAVQGLLLDLNRSRAPGSSVPGDWFFLHAGTGAQLLLLDPFAGDDDALGDAPLIPWMAWTRVAFQERDWPQVQVRPTEVRLVDRARREIPVAWSLEGEGLEGSLRVARAHLEVEEGPGPILPLTGFLDVEGEIRVLGETLRVRGIGRVVRR